MISLQEAVSDTLEELWISYNNIEKLKGITVLAKLKVRSVGAWVPRKTGYALIVQHDSVDDAGAVHVQQQREGLGGIPEAGRTPLASGSSVCR